MITQNKEALLRAEVGVSTLLPTVLPKSLAKSSDDKHMVDTPPINSWERALEFGVKFF